MREIMAQAVNSILTVRNMGWVGLGWVTPVQKIMGLVGLDPFAVGLGWVGLTNMDPCPSLVGMINQTFF